MSNGELIRLVLYNSPNAHSKGLPTVFFFSFLRDILTWLYMYYNQRFLSSGRMSLEFNHTDNAVWLAILRRRQKPVKFHVGTTDIGINLINLEPLWASVFVEFRIYIYLFFSSLPFSVYPSQFSLLWFLSLDFYFPWYLFQLGFICNQ